MAKTMHKIPPPQNNNNNDKRNHGSIVDDLDDNVDSSSPKRTRTISDDEDEDHDSPLILAANHRDESDEDEENQTVVNEDLQSNPESSSPLNDYESANEEMFNVNPPSNQPPILSSSESSQFLATLLRANRSIRSSDQQYGGGDLSAELNNTESISVPLEPIENGGGATVSTATNSNGGEGGGGGNRSTAAKTNVYQGLYPIADVKQYFEKEVVDGKSLYICRWQDCNFRTVKYSQHISRHIHLKHIGIKELRCFEDDCRKVFKRPESLVQHQKNHICGFGIDNERMKDPENICGVYNINRFLKKVLDNDIHVYKCQFQGCVFVTNNSGSIRRHVHNQHICPNSASATNGTSNNGRTSTANNQHNNSRNNGDADSERCESASGNCLNSRPKLEISDLVNALQNGQNAISQQQHDNNRNLPLNIPTIEEMQQMQQQFYSNVQQPSQNLYYLIQQEQQTKQRLNSLFGQQYQENQGFHHEERDDDEMNECCGDGDDDDDDDDEFQGQEMILRPEVEFTEYNDQMYDPVNKSSRPNECSTPERISDESQMKVKQEDDDDESDELPVDLTRPSCSNGYSVGGGNGRGQNYLDDEDDENDEDDDDEDNEDKPDIRNCSRHMMKMLYDQMCQQTNGQKDSLSCSDSIDPGTNDPLNSVESNSTIVNQSPKSSKTARSSRASAASKAGVGSVNQSNGSKSNGMYSLKNYHGFYRKVKIDNKMEFICIQCEQKNGMIGNDSEAAKSEYRFKSQISLIRHLWEELNFKDFNCEICEKKFENEFSLYKHRKFDHNQTESPPSMVRQSTTSPDISIANLPSQAQANCGRSTNKPTPISRQNHGQATPSPSPPLQMPAQGPFAPQSRSSPNTMPTYPTIANNNAMPNHPQPIFSEQFIENMKLNEMNQLLALNQQQQFQNQQLQLLKMLEMLRQNMINPTAPINLQQMYAAAIQLAASRTDLPQSTAVDPRARVVTPPHQQPAPSSSALHLQPLCQIPMMPNGLTNINTTTNGGDNGPINYNYFNLHPPLIPNLSPNGTDSDSGNNSRRSSPFQIVPNSNTTSNHQQSISQNSRYSTVSPPLQVAGQFNSHHHQPPPNSSSTTSSLIPLLTTPNQLGQLSDINKNNNKNQFGSNSLQNPNFQHNDRCSIDGTENVQIPQSLNILKQQMQIHPNCQTTSFNHNDDQQSSINGFGIHQRPAMPGVSSSVVQPPPPPIPSAPSHGIYSLRNYVNQYEKIVDPENNEKLYKCKLCANYSVRTPVSIVKHLRGHQQQPQSTTTTSHCSESNQIDPQAQQQSSPNRWNKQAKNVSQAIFNRQSLSTDEADNEEENEEDAEQETGTNEDNEETGDDLTMPGTSSSSKRQAKQNGKRRPTCGIYSLKAYPNDYVREKMRAMKTNPGPNNNSMEFNGGIGVQNPIPSGSTGSQTTNHYQYRCTNCERFITGSQASMIRHIWTHKNKKNFKCQQCDLSFSKEFSLYKHKKQNHPEQTSQTRIRNSGKQQQQQQQQRDQQLQNLSSNLIGTNANSMMVGPPSLPLQPPAPPPLQSQYALNLSAQNINFVQFHNQNNHNRRQTTTSEEDENESVEDAPVNVINDDDEDDNDDEEMQSTDDRQPEQQPEQQEQQPQNNSGISRRALRYKQSRPVHQIQQEETDFHKEKIAEKRNHNEEDKDKEDQE